MKVVLSTLGPLGMPMATQVVSRERADDPLYIPAIDQVRQGLDPQNPRTGSYLLKKHNWREDKRLFS